MARGIDRTELLELLAETVNNENPMLHLMSGNVCWSWISSFCELFWTLPIVAIEDILCAVNTLLNPLLLRP